MHFGENQLSRSLIGLSPLTTGHPPGFQPWWVRSSTKSYLRFNLPMARSLRFGSWARYSIALFGLAFATASPHGLTSQHTANSQAHSSKGTQSRRKDKSLRDAPTACRHTVSGTISLRSRGTFHHSLTVLSAIGHQGIFRLSGWSRQIHTGFLGPRATWVTLKQVADISATGVLPSTPGLSHALRLHQQFLTHRPAGRPIKKAPTTPYTQPLPGITRIRFGLIRFRSPLLPESRLFSLPAGTEMFHFPAFPPHTLCVQVWVTAHDDCRVSPFGHPRIKARLTAPRGLSRPPTSFIGSWCQGIHRAPLKTWPQMLASTVQFSNNDQSPVTHPIRAVHRDRRQGKQAPARALRHPTACPAGSSSPSLVPRPRRGSTGEADHPILPNSQRSTHEQPCETFARSRLCAP